eukprot:10892688-Lingulodinium_polyedra.AAC.1
MEAPLTRRMPGADGRRPPRSPRNLGLSWAARRGGLRPMTEPPPLFGVAHFGRDPDWRSRRPG